MISCYHGGGAVADILVRGLGDETVASIDDKAQAMGLSRNEYIRRFLALHHEAVARRKLTGADLAAAAEASKDLLDPEVMAGAWR
jgi:hypothetical protein